MADLLPGDARPDDALACVGCGGLVPDVDGSTHPYMQASPGCWQAYGELSALVHDLPVTSAIRWHHVDAYAVQHPGGADHDRRQRQSVAVHLVALCLLLECGQPPQQAAARRGRTSQAVLARLGRPDWPYLAPPAALGAVTAADVRSARTPAELESRAEAWLESAWTAWAPHHGTVRSWATLQQASR
jgi:hypothetical protein